MSDNLYAGGVGPDPGEPYKNVEAPAATPGTSKRNLPLIAASRVKFASEPTGDLRDETNFDDPPEASELESFLTERERLTYAIRLAALRTILRMEHRSFTEIADELCCTRAAISAAYRDLLAKFGCKQMFEGAHRRSLIAAATRANWAKKKGKAA